MEIRDLQLDDIAPFCQAIGQVAAEQRYILTTQTPPEDKMADWVKSYIDKPHVHFIAEHKEQLIGWCDIIPLPRQNQSHMANLGMGIVAGYRGQGLGQQLISRALARADAIAIQRIQLEVFSDNVAAIRLYQKHGFQQEGVKRKACFMRQRYLDIIAMARFKDGPPISRPISSPVSSQASG